MNNEPANAGQGTILVVDDDRAASYHRVLLSMLRWRDSALAEHAIDKALDERDIDAGR